MQISLNFKTSCSISKIIGLGAKFCEAFVFNFKRNYDVLKSNSPCVLLNKNIYFTKNETKSKMENTTHSSRETNAVLQLIKESQIKIKTVMNWSSRKKKEGIFCTIYFVRRKFSKTCVYLNVLCI